MRGTSAPAAGARGNPITLDRRRALSAAGTTLALVVAATFGLALALARVAGADSAVAARALVYSLLGGALVLALAARHLPGTKLGAANVVTLVRGALALLLAALIGSSPSAALAWASVVLALIALALDGVDGALARKHGETSAFGARFDMETDALTILVLCALVWQHGKAGAWVLIAGALRYLFVAAGFALPRLTRALPPSKRRQAVCVAQIASLIVCLLPFVTPPVSTAVALGGLAALLASFAADVARLARGSRA
jgi:phosphatidylglycerophosphate synthase